MVIFGEGYVYFGLLVQFSTNQCLFESGNEGTGTDGQGIILTLAALKCNTVHKTFEINNGHITVLNSTVFHVNGSRIALTLSVDLSVDILIAYLNVDLVNLHTLVLAKSNFRLQRNFCGKDERLASL